MLITECDSSNPGPAPEGVPDAALPPAPAAAQQPGEVAIQSLPYSSTPATAGGGVSSGGDGLISAGDGSVTAANATSLGSGLVYNGAGQVVSGSSGFGDNPSTYSGAASALCHLDRPCGCMLATSYT